jgi:hypothetical protein
MRGSRPGERRGGRQKGTPNKKTAFGNAVIAARAANENLTPLDVMLAVMRDPQVSLADRVKMALKALPRLHRKPKAGQSGSSIAGKTGAAAQNFGTPKDAVGGATGEDTAATQRDPVGGARKKGSAASSTPLAKESQNSNGKSASQGTNGNSAATAKGKATAEQGHKSGADLMPLDFLLGVIRHPKTPAAVQVKVSLATLPYTHPKQSSRPQKPAVVADRYGFEVDPALAKKLRNKLARLTQLKRRRNPHPRDQKTIQRLHQESHLIMAALQCPCPSQYSTKDVANDRRRLEHLWRKRRSRARLSPAEDGELARVNARYMAFAYGPEAWAEARMARLRDKDRQSRNAVGPRLSRRERAELRGLATLYTRELPKIENDILALHSAFSEETLASEEPADFEEFMTDQAVHDAAVEEMLARRKAGLPPH